MAKTLAEIYQAKDAKTRLFVQKHVDAIQKRPDVAGNGDSLYKGANVKEFDREGNRMGYCKGVDDAKAGEWDPNHVAEDNFSVVGPNGQALPGGTNINMAMAIAGRIARKDPKGNSYNVFQTRMNRTKMVRSVSRNGVTVTEDAPWVDVNEEVLDEKKRAKAPEYATSSNRYHGRGYWGSYGAGKIKEDGTGGPSDSQRDNEFAVMHSHVKKIVGASSKMVSHFLDSRHGRYIATEGAEGQKLVDTIGREWDQFKKGYKPEHFPEHVEPERPIELTEETLKHVESPRMKNWLLRGKK